MFDNLDDKKVQDVFDEAFNGLSVQHTLKEVGF